MIRFSLTRSPRSVIFTTTDRLFVLFVTRTIDPNGSVGWQAVIAYMLNRAPLAVFRPLNRSPYQEAIPCNRSPRFTAVASARSLGVGLVTKVGVGIVAAGRESRASACTATVDSVTTTAASATDEAPAQIQIFREAFMFMLRDFRFLTICLFY